MNIDIVALAGDYISVVTLLICACVGYAIKNVIPSQEINRFIPIIVMVLGGLIAMWSEWTCSPDVIARGFVSGLASTGAYEAIDQLRLRGYEKKVEGMATDPYELVGAEEDGD